MLFEDQVIKHLDLWKTTHGLGLEQVFLFHCAVETFLFLSSLRTETSLKNNELEGQSKVSLDMLSA